MDTMTTMDSGHTEQYAVRSQDDLGSSASFDSRVGRASPRKLGQEHLRDRG